MFYGYHYDSNSCDIYQLEFLRLLRNCVDYMSVAIASLILIVTGNTSAVKNNDTSSFSTNMFSVTS